MVLASSYRLTRFAACLCLAISCASAQEVSPPPEQATLRGYGAEHLQCSEWGDGCAVCRRDEAGVTQCSLPGIACQAAPMSCADAK